MIIEGQCARCGSKLGVRLDGLSAPVTGFTIIREIQRDGNEIYCQNCDSYVEPVNLSTQGGI